MADSKREAHDAMRPLWAEADARIQTDPNVTSWRVPGVAIRDYETATGLKITKWGGQLSVKATLKRPDGAMETVNIDFSEDPSDLSGSRITTERTESDGGYSYRRNGPHDYPRLASELLRLMPDDAPAQAA